MTSGEAVIRVVKDDLNCKERVAKSCGELGKETNHKQTGWWQWSLLRGAVLDAPLWTWTCRHRIRQIEWLKGEIEPASTRCLDKESVPAKKLLFPEPFRPTTTLCLGEKGSICVWSRSSRDLGGEVGQNSGQERTRLETLDREGLDVHRGPDASLTTSPFADRTITQPNMSMCRRCRGRRQRVSGRSVNTW